jgi:hypothetical protein
VPRGRICALCKSHDSQGRGEVVASRYVAGPFLVNPQPACPWVVTYMSGAWLTRPECDLGGPGGGDPPLPGPPPPPDAVTPSATPPEPPNPPGPTDNFRGRPKCIVPLRRDRRTPGCPHLSLAEVSPLLTLPPPGSGRRHPHRSRPPPEASSGGWKSHRRGWWSPGKPSVTNRRGVNSRRGCG